MASFPQFYANYSSIFPTDFSSDFPISSNNILNNNNYSMCGGSGHHHHHHHEDQSFINNNPNMLDHIVPLMDSCFDTNMPNSSSSWGLPTCSSSSSEIAAATTMAVPAIISSNNSAAAGANNNGINGGYPILPLHLGEFGEECCGFVDDIKPPITLSSYPNNTPTETWGSFHQGNQMGGGGGGGGGVEESNNIKVGRYSEEERKERIVRYLKKRNQRNFNKTIKYACRKTLADRRVRVRGRFARNNELCEDEISTIKKMNDNLPHKHDLYYAHHHHDSIQFQLKNEDDEDDWLQEAMASLVYLSHSSPEEI